MSIPTTSNGFSNSVIGFSGALELGGSLVLEQFSHESTWLRVSLRELGQ